MRFCRIWNPFKPSKSCFAFLLLSWQAKNITFRFGKYLIRFRISISINFKLNFLVLLVHFYFSVFRHCLLSKIILKNFLFFLQIVLCNSYNYWWHKFFLNQTTELFIWDNLFFSFNFAIVVIKYKSVVVKYIFNIFLNIILSLRRCQPTAFFRKDF